MGNGEPRTTTPRWALALSPRHTSSPSSAIPGGAGASAAAALVLKQPILQLQKSKTNHMYIYRVGQVSRMHTKKPTPTLLLKAARRKHWSFFLARQFSSQLCVPELLRASCRRLLRRAAAGGLRPPGTRGVRPPTDQPAAALSNGSSGSDRARARCAAIANIPVQR